jgi:hypothetical protein
MIRDGIETYYVESEVNENDYVVKYEFNDNYDNRFMVQFKNDTVGPQFKPMLGNSYELTWYVWDVNDWSVTKIVNGNIFSILYTVFGDILSGFLTKRPWVTTVRFEGIEKEKEKEILTQRTKFYLRHLRKNSVNGFRLENWGNKILLIKIKN